MPDNVKKDLFLNTLQNSYNQKNYVRFLQELLNNVTLVNPNKFNKEYGSLSYIIDDYYSKRHKYFYFARVFSYVKRYESRSGVTARRQKNGS